MSLKTRAAVHAALGDEQRLRMVDALVLNDMTFRELAAVAGLESNLAAHHLRVLEHAGLIARRESAGDRRRRYVSLRFEALGSLTPWRRLRAQSVLFVCTHNSARSQFAEALLHDRSSLTVQSAGMRPAPAVHPKAVKVAAENGLDLEGKQPKPYSVIERAPDLIISVCDRAFESDVPLAAPRLHWSIPDPLDSGHIGAFRAAFGRIATRVDRLIEIIETRREQEGGP